MIGKLKYLTLFLGAILLLPVGTIYRQNIEVWAENQGLDSILRDGVVAMSDNPIGLLLLALMLMSFGAAAGLWTEYWLRSKSPLKIKPMEETITGETFRHQRIDVDGLMFVKCKFEGVTLVCNGTASYGFDQCEFFGTFSIDFPNPQIGAALGLFKLAQQLGVPINLDGDKKTLLPSDIGSETPL